MRIGVVSSVRSRRLFAAATLVVGGVVVFAVAVVFANVQVGNSAAFVRAGYCSVAGDTDESGNPLQPGTFLDLTVGAPSADSHYVGAVPANYVAGVGLVCSAPPPGYVHDGYVDGAGHPGGVYPYFVKPGGS